MLPSRILFPEIAGLGAEVVLHISAEVPWRRKAEHVGDIGERQAAVAQAAADVERCVARDPVVGGQAAHLFGISERYFEVTHSLPA